MATKNYKKIKSAFLDDPEVLRSVDSKEQKDLITKLIPKEGAGAESFLMGLRTIFKGDQGQQGTVPVKGVDYLTDEELKKIKEESTPIKGVHYFTPDEVQQVADYVKDIVKDQVKEEVRPIRGIDYRDGKDGLDGRDGKNADEGNIIRSISKMIPTKEEILSSIKITEDGVVSKVLKQIPKTQEFPTVENIIREIKKKKSLELRDIKGARLDMNDQRWHGSGGGSSSSPLVIEKDGVVVSSTTTDINFTGSGVTSVTKDPITGVVTIDISGGTGTMSWISEAPSGVQNGVNKTFTLSNTPITGSLILEMNSGVNIIGTDFTLSGNTITYIVAPSPVDVLWAIYPIGSGSATATDVWNEVVAGSGTTFTLANTPVAGTVRVFGNGQRLTPTVDYTILGAVITTISSWSAGQILADYEK